MSTSLSVLASQIDPPKYFKNFFLNFKGVYKFLVPLGLDTCQLMNLNVFFNLPNAMTFNEFLAKQQRIPKFGKPGQFMTVKCVSFLLKK
jgi:hypothetical protein